MADALCGPSNALQSFQKHTAVDRTLQQDRLVNRHPSVQPNFRSQHPNAAALDPEFEAFENNFSGNAAPQLGVSGAFDAPLRHQPPPAFSASDNVDWASDFQKLQVSGPPQNLMQHHVMPAQSFRSTPMNGWQNEFAQQQHQQQVQQNTQTHFQQAGTMANYQAPFMSTYPGVNGMVASIPAGQGSIQAPSTFDKASVSFDESAFAAAFDQAQADMHEQEIAGSEQHQILEVDMGSKNEESTLQTESHEEIRIGSDLIGPNSETNIQEQKEDSDELARTAGHLLDSLSHDNSQKFKESNFLALMRRIRDREVHIEGDEFRETTQALHPGGKDYPGKCKTGDAGSNANDNPTSKSIRPE
ncbi:hypothetical protein UA08_05776 [Talaromyces atroroseus]|uniref:Peroxin 20 n=1 Tax=Talaromyces atroroseus TaxID=1441469 RepID=A0A225AD51_TALAT|nr:hypothetical protein UA08_05776 [Talaromyces atroroseus]OKL59091.1 hypothetical protein UA08_05776 [Talaromyces atroroseus]